MLGSSAEILLRLGHSTDEIKLLHFLKNIFYYCVVMHSIGGAFIAVKFDCSKIFD